MLQIYSAIQKLPEEIKRVAQEKEVIFNSDPFDVRLRTHKLSGRMKGLYAFWIKYKFRIVLKFEDKDKNIVRFHQIGDHDIYE